MCKSKERENDMVFKIDLEKIYDHVNWDFFEFYLKKYQFSPIIKKVIMHCVTRSCMLILWNERQLPYFVPTRGLWQCDSLSPYLFIIYMELLSHIVASLVDEGHYNLVRLSHYGPPSIAYIFMLIMFFLFAKVSNSKAGTVFDILNHFPCFLVLKWMLLTQRCFLHYY